MKKIGDETKRVLVKICRMYYFDNMTQQEISTAMNMSRSKVSRSLTVARDLGIVKIFIDDEFSDEQKLEKALVEKFGIKEARVMNAEDHSPSEIEQLLGSALTTVMDHMLKDNDIIGVMAGYTVNGVSANMGSVYRDNLQIVPLVGGMGGTGASWQVSQSTMLLADKLKAPYYILNCPTNVSSIEAKNILMKEPEIKEVLSLAKKCTVALLGIGEISDTATLISIGAIKKQDEKELIKKKAKASMGTGFFDEDGNVLDVNLSKHMIGIGMEDLRKIPNVIAVAYGSKKADAIRAALKSHIIDILITDSETAEKILMR